METISIIIPIYNAELYLDRCIASVVKQTYSNLEIVLVNDGSTDKSLDICQRWKLLDNRIKLYSQQNLGVSATRNLGLRKSTGDYIMFIDSDDYMFPDMCSVMYNKMKKKNADLVICGIQEEFNFLWCPVKDIDYKSFYDFTKDFVYQLNTELLSPCWNKIYRRTLIDEFFNEDVSFGEDLVFNLNYIKCCKVISLISTPLLFHEKNIEGSLVTKVDLKRLVDIEFVHREIMKFDVGNEVGIHDKYSRDINVYVRRLLSSNINFLLKKSILKEWIKESFIKKYPISTLFYTLSDRVLFILLKYRFFTLANLLVSINFRAFFRFHK